ncbi:thioredoxin family protein [Amaricoccus sp.]|uniref:DUF1223 domain-containing protein n=1 Tax=Amaricoccus sp. TaxID=1872485 RepID=UPI00261D286F|nr:DUF1223 domain-containing protein [uncultured Amaricoccus sp.]
MNIAPIVLSPIVLSLSILLVPRGAEAQSPVVLELFTSQGCSSCPPADELLTELSQIDGVIALALHVDYWDYFGWKDTFGDKAYTKRQKTYARALRQRTLFTPQMIVQGEEMVVGRDAATIFDRIAEHRSQPAPVDLGISRDGDVLKVELAPRVLGIGPADVQVVEFTPTDEVLIEGGENAGKSITYTNVVTNWQVVGRWDGATATELSIEDVGKGPLAVIVQEASQGQILNAAKLP